MPQLGLAAGAGEGQSDCQVPGWSLPSREEFGAHPQKLLAGRLFRGINHGADRIARRAIALALNRLTESAGAASGAVMLRTVLVRVGFRGLDALLCLQGGKRELPGARQPALALAYISWICLW